MSTGMRRTGWGLALAVLCIGSMAQAQQYLPPPGPPEPLTRMPAVIPTSPTNMPSLPSKVRVNTLPQGRYVQMPQQPGPTAQAAESHGEEHKEAHKEEQHEEHHGEEEHDAFWFDAEYLLIRPYR